MDHRRLFRSIPSYEPSVMCCTTFHVICLGVCGRTTSTDDLMASRIWTFVLAWKKKTIRNFCLWICVLVPLITRIAASIYGAKTFVFFSLRSNNNNHIEEEGYVNHGGRRQNHGRPEVIHRRLCSAGSSYTKTKCWPHPPLNVIQTPYCLL